MSKSTTSHRSRHFSLHAALAALGVKLRRLHVFAPIEAQVRIEQKVLKNMPHQKLWDAFISLLAGTHGLGEINTRVRSDPEVQAAIGGTRYAEQSMEHALTTIYRQRSPAYGHDYQAAWQGLDVDLSALLCGKKAAFATKGYFAKQRIRWGRQLGRVLASEYGDIVVDHVFSGAVQLAATFPPLVGAAAETLELDAARRARTILRMDARGDSLADVNWALARGYAVHCKDYSAMRGAIGSQCEGLDH